MADLPRYEKWALLLTAGFILFTGGWFLAGHSSPEPYTITAAHPGSSASLQPAASGSMDGSRPDSLLEGEVIDLNTAAPEDLERLPGIGPAKAEAIAAYRAEHGPFQSVDQLTEVSESFFSLMSISSQLTEVSGIGEATLETLRPYITASAPG